MKPLTSKELVECDIRAGAGEKPLLEWIDTERTSFLLTGVRDLEVWRVVDGWEIESDFVGLRRVRTREGAKLALEELLRRATSPLHAMPPVAGVIRDGHLIPAAEHATPNPDEREG